MSACVCRCRLCGAVAHELHRFCGVSWLNKGTLQAVVANFRVVARLFHHKALVERVARMDQTRLGVLTSARSLRMYSSTALSSSTSACRGDGAVAIAALCACAALRVCRSRDSAPVEPKHTGLVVLCAAMSAIEKMPSRQTVAVMRGVAARRGWQLCVDCLCSCDATLRHTSCRGSDYGTTG